MISWGFQVTFKGDVKKKKKKPLSPKRENLKDRQIQKEIAKVL